MQKKLVLVTPLPDDCQAALRERFPELTIVDCSQARDLVVTEIEDTHIVFGRVKPEEFAAARHLELIQVGGHGVELFLYPELVQSNVIVCNTNTLCVDVMAEHVLALLLAFNRDLPLALEHQKQHLWRGPRRWTNDFRGQTIGFLGTGCIGTRAAEVVAALGCRPIGCSNSGQAGPVYDEVFPASRLHGFLGACDAVVSSLPYTPETDKLMDAAAFASMRPSALFINVGRGRTVDEDALMAALRNSTIAGAALDVTAIEPLPEDSPLWDTPNLLITPHRSGDSPTNLDRIFTMLTENIRRHLADEPVLSRVDLARGY